MFNKKKYMKEYRAKNKEEIIEAHKKYNVEHRDEINENSKKYYIKNKTKILKKRNQYYGNNHEKVAERNERWRKNNPEYMKQWRKTNCEKAREDQRQWRENNLGCVREYQRQWMNKKRKADLKFNLNWRMATAIGRSLKSNKLGRCWWEKLVGYTCTDLKKHLQKTIPNGYTWQNYLDGKLQMDHIIPKSVFNFTKPEHIDFKRCWALDNLRLLPDKENLIKGDKLEKAFQPALKL